MPKISIVQKADQAFRLISPQYQNSRARDATIAFLARDRTRKFAASANRFVVFLVPGENIVNGGIMSIFSIAVETQKFFEFDGVSVAVCTGYGEPRILRYTKFDNDIKIMAFTDLLSWFPPGSEVLIHLPEMFVQKFGSDCIFIYQSRPDLKWRFNILLQNIDLIPPKHAVKTLQTLGKTSATIAHKAYATAHTDEVLGCPGYYLSWRLCPEDFDRTEYDEKRKVIVISPDAHPAKNEVVRRLAGALPDHKIIEIKNMTYRKYRAIIKYAKFSFTFGEGLDAYFIEAIFSGGVGMAIFNERFFTPDYRNLDGIFGDSDDAIESVARFVRDADEKTQYRKIRDRQTNIVAKEFVREAYLKNIRAFYEVTCADWIKRQH